MTPEPACGGHTHWQLRADVVVIGTGVAGLVAALAAHRRGRRVMVLSKAAETAGLARASVQRMIEIGQPGGGE